MENLEVVSTKEMLGKSFTVYGTVEEPLFLAKDVAEMIEHSNVTKMLESIDDDEKVKIRPNQKLGLLTSNNTYNFLTENGLYEVLMQSTKPIAKEFKKGVKELLHNLRTNKAVVVPVKDERLVKMEVDKVNLERAKFIYAIGKESPVETYREICAAISVNMVAGQKVLPMPEADDDYKSATEVGKMLGISRNKVGQIANENGLKIPEYTKRIWDRATNGKMVENWVYNSKGIEKIKEFING